METLDALDAIEDLSDADELKNKLLFSVVVVSTFVQTTIDLICLSPKSYSRVRLIFIYQVGHSNMFSTKITKLNSMSSARYQIKPIAGNFHLQFLKNFIKVQLTKSDPKRTRSEKYLPLCHADQK